MIVAGETVTLLVTAEAVDVLKTLSVNVLDPPTVVVFVEVTDDLGLWIRVRREDGNHQVLIRWDYILAVDAKPPAAAKPAVGF